VRPSFEVRHARKARPRTIGFRLRQALPRKQVGRNVRIIALPFRVGNHPLQKLRHLAQVHRLSHDEIDQNSFIPGPVESGRRKTFAPRMNQTDDRVTESSDFQRSFYRGMPPENCKGPLWNIKRQVYLSYLLGRWGVMEGANPETSPDQRRPQLAFVAALSPINGFRRRQNRCGKSAAPLQVRVGPNRLTLWRSIESWLPVRFDALTP